MLFMCEHPTESMIDGIMCLIRFFTHCNEVIILETEYISNFNILPAQLLMSIMFLKLLKSSYTVLIKINVHCIYA